MRRAAIDAFGSFLLLADQHDGLKSARVDDNLGFVTTAEHRENPAARYLRTLELCLDDAGEPMSEPLRLPQSWTSYLNGNDMATRPIIVGATPSRPAEKCGKKTLGREDSNLQPHSM